MAQLTLEAILTEHVEKIEQLTLATTIIRNKENVTNELAAARKEVSLLKTDLNSARSDLETMKNRNEDIKNMSKQLDELLERITHMNRNVPQQLLYDYANIQMNESKHLAGVSKEATPNCQRLGSEVSDDVFEKDTENMVKNCKKILFNEPEALFPKIKLLGQEEFEIIPKYMIGRQTLDALNQFLTTINEILEAKYSLIALGKNGAKKKGKLDVYMAFKSQESVDEKEKDKIYFFTADDYLRHTKTKLDRTKLTLLTVLRHCKRLREIRASKVIQYAVVPSV